MAASYRCPQCNRLLTAPDQLFGQEVQCPSCGAIFTAGSASTPSAHFTSQAVPPPLSSTRDFPPQREPIHPSSPDFLPSFQKGREPDDYADDYSPRQRNEFLPGRGKASTAIVFLVLSIGVSLLVILANYLELRFFYLRQKGEVIAQGEAQLLELLMLRGWLFEVLTYVACLITILMWFYQAHKNLDQLHAKDRSISPGWAVGWFFIPIMNLFKPYQAMQELWKASDPNGAYQDPYAWKKKPGSSLVGWWWGFWITSNIAANYVARASFRQNLRPNEWESLMYGSIISELLSLLAAICLIWIIRVIQTRQGQKNKLLFSPESAYDDIDD